MVLVVIDEGLAGESVGMNAFDGFGKKQGLVAIDEGFGVLKGVGLHLIDTLVWGRIGLGDDVLDTMGEILCDWNIGDKNVLEGRLGGVLQQHGFGVGGVDGHSFGIVEAKKEHCVVLRQIHQNLIVVAQGVF